MRLDDPEQTSLRVLDDYTIGAVTTVLYSFIQRGLDDAETASEKALRGIVYDPLGRSPPDFYLHHLELALNSNAVLSSVFPDFNATEAQTRKYISRIVERIRAGTDAPKLRIDDGAVLADWIPPRLEKLMRPIHGSTVSEEELDAIAHEIGNLPFGQDGTYIFLNAIRRAVRGQARLAQFAPGWSEQAIRDYLIDLGYRIIKEEDAANHRRYVKQMAAREQKARGQHEIDRARTQDN